MEMAVVRRMHIVLLRHVLLLICGSFWSEAAGALTVSGSPSSCYSAFGFGSSWGNPGRAVSSNDSYATASVDGWYTNYLVCTGYNFSIPAGATINGITVNVERRSSSESNGGSRDEAVRLIKDGAIGTTDRSTGTIYESDRDVTEPHGGPADLWGTSWTADDINNGEFGVAFQATKPRGNGSPHIISVDAITITVDYTPYSPFTCDPPSNIPSGVAVTCQCDTFGRSALNPSTILGGNWVVSNSDNISNPYINSLTGLLRLTENTNNNAKAATAPGIFPAAGNYISVEFNHYAYNGSGADGVAVTLSDYSVPAVPGAFGGSLGYAQKTAPSVSGFAGGWLGVGLDEYGNFQSATEGRVGGACTSGACRPESVGVRGPGSGINGYRWIGGTASNVGIDNNTSASPGPGYMYQVIVDARGSGTGQVNVTVNRDTTTRNGATYAPLFGPSNVYNEAQYALSQGWISKLVPDYWKISFTASTGGSTNIHEIGRLRICAQTMYPSTGGVASGFSAIDEAYPVASNSTVPAYQDFQTGGIFMKLAGVPFKLWVAALTDTGIANAYSAVSAKHVRVNLIDNSDNACGSDASRTCNSACTSKPAVETGASQIVSYASSDKGAKLSPSFTVNSAYKNLIAVIKECIDASCASYAATAPACSADSFSVRPTGIVEVKSTDATNTGTSDTPVFKAGAQSFNLTATTAGVAGSPGRYNGIPKINNAAVQAISPATIAGSLSGDFAPAISGTPSSTATGSFTYSEVGSFRFLGYSPAVNATAPRGVYDGVMSATECAPPMTTADCDVRKAVTWTGIDSISTESDCVADSYSNTKNGEGKYGCNFGITDHTLAFGRFIPNHFSISGATITNRSGASCTPASPFTYMGEPAGISFTLHAMNASNEVTRNYTGPLAKLSTTNWLPYGADNSIGLWMMASDYPVGAGNCKVVFSNSTPSSTDFACAGVVAPPSVPRVAGPRVRIAGTPAAPNWMAGQSQWAADVVLERADRPDGSYATLHMGIAPRDADGVRLLSFNLDMDNSGTDERASVGSTQVFYGQARIENTYGSERLELPVKVSATVWNGTRFTINALDSCSPTAGFGLDSWAGGLAENSTSISNTGVLQNGERKLVLTAPSPAPSTKGSVRLNSNLPYLPGAGHETFGIYKSRFIYLREMY